MYYVNIEMVISHRIQSLVLVATVLALVQCACGQIGVSYSPLVRENDGFGSARYTRDDVKVMLELVRDAGYFEISTYGMGAPPEEYIRNVTWKRCASVVHTGLAAAELNSQNPSPSHPKLSVYQGIFSLPDMHLRSEIEVAFEIAELSNSIHPGTVKDLIFPSSTSLDQLFTPQNQDAISEISTRSKSMGLSYGIRLWNCPALVDRKNDPNLPNILSYMNFVICLVQPSSEETFRRGPEPFLEQTLGEFSFVKEAIREMTVGSNRPLEVWLETGWPGGDHTGQNGTEVRDLLTYWDLVKKRRGDLKIFMLEAFDNPVKREIAGVPHARYYGRWRHTQSKDNSKNAYELKRARVPRPKEPEVKGGGGSRDLTIGVVVGLVLFTMLVLMIVIAYRRFSRKLAMGKRLTEEEIRQFLDGIVTNEVIQEGKGDAWQRVPYNRDFELERDKFEIDKSCLLGSGQFGSVFKGKIHGLVNEVAFKTTRPDCPLSALRGLLSEIKILAYLGKHENLVSICGAYTRELSEANVYLATELCTNGSLEKYLRNEVANLPNSDPVRYVNSPAGNGKAEIPDSDLVKWSLQIASAMEYISSKNVIHADLATRNVLLTSNLTAKVTDFGLSRRLYEYTEYVKQQQEPLPWRWMSVESLKKLEFSTKSDVWSYGITLWEIFSLGDIPYPGLAWNVEFVGQLENGLRMQVPARADSSIYKIMTDCWHVDPTCRPSFQMIKDALNSSKAAKHNS